MTLAEFVDLAIKPSQALLQIGALGFKRVDDLLHARQVILAGRERAGAYASALVRDQGIGVTNTSRVEVWR